MSTTIGFEALQPTGFKLEQGFDPSAAGLEVPTSWGWQNLPAEQRQALAESAVAQLEQSRPTATNGQLSQHQVEGLGALLLAVEPSNHQASRPLTRRYLDVRWDLYFKKLG